MDWLDHRHLIGALNLDQALSDAAPILQAGSNPHLVHVGGGIASIGEQRADVLVKRIPIGHEVRWHRGRQAFLAGVHEGRRGEDGRIVHASESR